MRKALIALLMLPVLAGIADARSFICGMVARHHFKLPPIVVVNGKRCNLNLAREWASCYPHVGMQEGAVLVQSRKGRALGGGPGGHVSVIKIVLGPCSAIVHDEKGTYERDTCSRRIAVVMPTTGTTAITWRSAPFTKNDNSALMMR
jgi:hypothetical protein